MKPGWLAFAGVIASMSWAEETYGISRGSRHFVPQAVVVAKKKLREISDGPTKHRRRELVDALEMLFADFGIEQARTATNDVLAGRYGFFSTLSQNDRTALAPIVADLKALFPEETGMASRLKAEMSTLAKLQTDENPTVAKRATWLVEMANGRWVKGYSKANMMVAARSFLKLGRSGLLAYRNISEEEISRLRERLPELEMLLKSKNRFTVERASVLVQVAARNEVPGISEMRAKDMTLRFLASGRVLPSRGVKGVTQPSEELAQRLPELEILAKDENRVVAERAQMLIDLAKGKAAPFSNTTTSQIRRAFLDRGRIGLLNYQSLNPEKIDQLVERLPELKILAQDKNPRVANKAKALIQLAEQGDVTSLKRNSLAQSMTAFLDRGRAGLFDREEVSNEQMESLKARVSELEALANDHDADSIVRGWAKVLIDAANGKEIDVKGGSPRAAANAFLLQGQEGLAAIGVRGPFEVDGLLKLPAKLPELEALSLDENTAVAKRALRLIEVAKGKVVTPSRRITALINAFVTYGREALLEKPKLGPIVMAELTAKEAALEKLSRDPDPEIAHLAKLLLKVVHRDDTGGVYAQILDGMATAFLGEGRAGLKSHRRLPAKRVAQLAESRFALVALSLDENATVASRAKVLLKVVDGQAIGGYDVTEIRRFSRYFLQGGRAGLVGGDSISQKDFASLLDKLTELEELAKDDDPVVAQRAQALIGFAKKSDVPGYAMRRLKRMASAFLANGHAGLRKEGLLDIETAESRVGEVSQ